MDLVKGCIIMLKEKECMYYEKLSNDTVKCTLCPHYCFIEDKKAGLCKVRYNKNGTLLSTNYGRISSYAMDPIEKKPLKDYYPGYRILSIGTFGCNLECGFCQNHNISQEIKEGVLTTPQNIVDMAIHEKNNIGIAFTYNEPSIWYEFVLDTAKLNQKKGKKNVLVTNGYINQAPLKELLPYIDAMNIDLKGFSDEYYKECKGRIRPVLDTIKTSAQKCHIEITTLLVTGKNDNIETIEDIARYISTIDDSIPLHLSRYFPRYQYKQAPTDIHFMNQAKKIGSKYLKKVYLGNV